MRYELNFLICINMSLQKCDSSGYRYSWNCIIFSKRFVMTESSGWKTVDCIMSKKTKMRWWWWWWWNCKWTGTTNIQENSFIEFGMLWSTRYRQKREIFSSPHHQLPKKWFLFLIYTKWQKSYKSQFITYRNLGYNYFHIKMSLT